MGSLIAATAINLLDDPDFFHCEHLHAIMKKSVCVKRQGMLKNAAKLTGKPTKHLPTDLVLSFECCAACPTGQRIRHELSCKEVGHMTENAAPDKPAVSMINKPDKPQQKRCKGCKAMKPMEEFSRDKSTKDGRNRFCRTCKNEMQREYRHKKTMLTKAKSAHLPRNRKTSTPKMEDKKQMPATSTQPTPKTGGKTVLHQVMIDLVTRAELGERKYGTLLQTHNGRDPLVDGYQELLDLVMYLRQALMEREVTP